MPEPFELPDQLAGMGLGVAFVAEPSLTEILVGLVAQSMKYALTSIVCATATAARLSPRRDVSRANWAAR